MRTKTGAAAQVRAALHRAFFRVLSLAGPGLQRRILEAVFEHRHRASDHWGIGTTPYEQQKAERTLSMLRPGPFGRVLEVGCSEGCFTERLAASGCGEQIVATDISQRALDRAAARCRRFDHISFRRLDVLSEMPEGSFDLVLCAEILYYLGGPEQLERLRDRLAGSLAAGGLLLLVHPWPQAQGYHQIFQRGAGLRLLREHVERDPQRPYALGLFEKA